MRSVKHVDFKARNVKHIRIENVKTLYEAYEFQEKIGQGSYGIVVAAVEKKTNTEYAIKIINKFAPGAKYLEDIQREVNILKTVNHPHIIVLEKIYESVKKFYLIFEKCADNLLHVFKEKYPFTEKTNKEIIRQLVSAVYYLHKNDIVHRDIKMENILLTRTPANSNDEFDIKLSDFGLSVIKGGAGIQNMLKERCGTITYMAPEILLQHTYSELCDVWSIGVILYALLLGKFPFHSPKMDDLVDLILNTDPNINPKLIGPDAADLLGHIFKKDPVYRITALEILKHPWLVDSKTISRKGETIIDYMKKWRNELMLPGEESDWISTYVEPSEYSFLPQSCKNVDGGEKTTPVSNASSSNSLKKWSSPILETISDKE